MLCGDGVLGCHGLIEHHDVEKCARLAASIWTSRVDTVTYLEERFPEGAQEWLRRMYGLRLDQSTS